MTQALLPIPDDRVTSLDDCVASLDHVRTLPFLDGARVTLCGSSLGGHLVARMAGQRKVHGAILSGAVLPGVLGAKVPEGATGHPQGGFRNVEAIPCPILLLVGQDYFMADLNRRFYDLLAAAHKPVNMEFCLHAYHGFQTGARWLVPGRQAAATRRHTRRAR